MAKQALLCAILIGLCAMPCRAAGQDVLYRPAASWVVPPPVTAAAITPSEVPARFVYFDNQVRIAPDGTEEDYTAYRIKILKPEGLAVGNLQVSWQPDAGSMSVHYVHIIRGEQTIDVLATTKFTVLQREAQLEQSMLTGQRTATLQVPGLQTGDELAFAATTAHRENAFEGRAAGLMQMPVLGVAGTFRLHMLWPKDRQLGLQASQDLTLSPATLSDDQHILNVTMVNPKGAIPTDGAPARYNVRRLIEYSDFGAWSDVSRLLSQMFERAGILAADSPIRGEAAQIAARTNDPTERAQAALQLVEDRIRYVFVGLDGANYVPASADLTWQRRFGDCKAKSVLLVALLRALGIDAAPALVNSNGGDGMDQRLPSPRPFDHVVVRAVIAGKVVWLDGTRLGDRYLANLPSPFRWALPLTPTGSALERIAPRDVALPIVTEIVDIDASKGVQADAAVSIQNILRGDEAQTIWTRLKAISAEDADRAVRAYWHQEADWVTPDKVSWRFEERQMALSLAVVGRGNPGWTGDDRDGHSLTIMHAGFYPPDALRRPTDQDQAASWAVAFPRYRCSATTIRVPAPAKGFNWSLYAEPMSRRLGGIAYWRAAGFSGNVVRTLMSTHSYEPEASPQEADVVNRAIPGFNNNMSNIAEVKPGAVIKASSKLPFGDTVDWLNAPTPCAPAA